MYPNPFNNPNYMGKFGQRKMFIKDQEIGGQLSPSNERFMCHSKQQCGHYYPNNEPEMVQYTDQPYIMSPKQMMQFPLTNSSASFNDVSALGQQIDFLKMQVETLEQIVRQQQNLLMLQQKQQQQLIIKSTGILEKDSEKIMTKRVASASDNMNWNQNQLKLDHSINTLNNLCEVFAKFYQQNNTKTLTPPENEIENYKKTDDEKRKAEDVKHKSDEGKRKEIERQKKETEENKLKKAQEENKKQIEIKLMEGKKKGSDELDTRRKTESITKSKMRRRAKAKENPNKEKMPIRILSDAPTALIAPADYQHIYSIKDKHARYLDPDFQNKLTKKR